MLFVAQANLIALLLGLLIGLVTAYWVYRGRRGRIAEPAPTTTESRAQETPRS